MPFDSEKQRRFLWANKPEVAKQIAYKNEGGMMMDGRKPSKVIKKDRYGNQITFEYEPEIKPLDQTAIVKHMMDQDIPEVDMEMDHPGEPKGSDTVPAWLTPGEFVVNAEAMRIPGAKEVVEDINDQGRAMQQMQGGSIPHAYEHGGAVQMHRMAGGIPMDGPPHLQAGGPTPFIAGPRLNAEYLDDGGWITDDLLDRLAFVESSNNNDAVSKAGAIGKYQWLPSSAKQAGYGVKAFDPKDEKAARAATAKYLRNMQKHHGFTPEETLRAYNWGPGNVLKHKKGKRKDIPAEALNYPGKILGWDKIEGVPAPADMPLPKARPVAPEAPPSREAALASTHPEAAIKEEMPAWKSFLNKYILGERAQFKDDGGSIYPDPIMNLANQNQSNIVPALTDVPKGHQMFGGNQNIAGDVVQQGPEPYEAPWYSSLLGHKSKAALGIPLDENEQRLQQEAGKFDSAINPSLVGDDPVGEGYATEDIEGTGMKTDAEIGAAGETAIVDDLDPKHNKEFKDEVKNKVVEKIDDIAKKDANSTGPGADQKGSNASEEEVVDAAKKDPSTVDKAAGFLKEAFGDLFDGKELARAAILYAGSRALGYSHSGSLQYTAKNYLTRVDAKAKAKIDAAATKDKRAFELAKTDKFTPQSVAAYKKSGNPGDLVSKKSVAGAVPTGVTESRLINGKKVAVQQVKLPNGSIGYNIPGKGNITKAQLENATKPYDPSFDKGTSEYRTRRSRAVKSNTELFKEIQLREGRYKDGEEYKYRTGIIPSQAAHDFWSFAESYNIDPESDEAKDLMGAAYRNAIQQSSLEGAPVAKDLKPFLEAAYIRQSTGAPELFQVNPDKDVKETAKYVRSDKMQKLTSSLDSIASSVLPKATKTDARNQMINALVNDWGNLSEKDKKQWNRRANKGIETGFFLYAQDKANDWLINQKIGE